MPKVAVEHQTSMAGADLKTVAQVEVVAVKPSLESCKVMMAVKAQAVAVEQAPLDKTVDPMAQMAVKALAPSLNGDTQLRLANG